MRSSPKHLKILAMDSTAPRGGAALLEGERLVVQCRFQGQEGHVALLPAAIADLFDKTGWNAATLDLIVITLGPGSFSGLRIALGMAQGMALVHQTAVVGVSSLELLAAGVDVADGREPVAAILDARRGEVFFGVFQQGKNHPLQKLWGVETGPPELLATALVAFLAQQGNDIGVIHFTGSGLGPYGDIFQTAFGTRFVPAPEKKWELDPVVLGRLGLQIFLQQGAMPISTLEPLYQRQPDAVVKLSEKTKYLPKNPSA